MAVIQLCLKRIFFTSICVLNHNFSYSEVSTDYNPKNLNPQFASHTFLPRSIIHGKWTSASTRKLVKTFILSAGHLVGNCGTSDDFELVTVSIIDNETLIDRTLLMKKSLIINLALILDHICWKMSY
ncbi:hypothetical protein CONCODRAFT_5293 [Conidiobolus coronatus NRRL 28638]|uniref:Uncharacterized protein n=1 Tax=Conidiobolus coronatus (strain ATCC 28846 / CBS 209.66 / NRRL 28638) TaxID=796925 RepID=A0A137PAI2_CONC2|nr:hypothetical protein CONCODRAFT_5293 [Conidiobolus coronatus NRRL 28638]|eukprot:KXN71964.1 hypothetical protein CONCODRAFT_5293 [Conidiobolus coronatus NRRL 28638]